MASRSFKLRFRRQWRKQRRQVENISQQAGDELERHFFKRLAKFDHIWRFVLGWLVLFGLLIGCTVAQINLLGDKYQTPQPIAGGIYTEGIVGAFSNASPLYASGEVDDAVAHLVFAGLLKYDQSNRLVGDLAEKWSVNQKGTVYTVQLRPNLVWHDGQPLTADDVVFTYKTIQNPDAQSPLRASWQDVTVSKLDDRTVTFTLTNPLSSFPYNLTNGIVPEHVLAAVDPADLRSVDFNTKHPVGAGPFKWQAVEVSGTSPDDAEVQIALSGFRRYHAGAPKLSSFVVHTYANPQKLITDLKNGQLSGAAGLQVMPSELKDEDSLQVHNFTTTVATMVFFNTSRQPLDNVNVRRALVQGTNIAEVTKQLDYPARLVRSPLLKGQLGYSSKYDQARYNPERANAILQKAGWKMGKDGIRSKKGQSLQFGLLVADTPEYRKVSQALQRQWQKLGVRVMLQVQETSNFHNTLAARSYDAVLDGISIGADPDVFVYWDSTQSGVGTGGLNFSQYRSATADLALESGRTRLNPKLRIIKYQPFLEAWQKDAPALGLYQPRYLYITRGTVYGLEEHTLNKGSDRFNNVVDWMTHQAKVTE